MNRWAGKVTYPRATPCGHCRDLTPTTKLYRIAWVGWRVLCDPCFSSLDAMGFDMKVKAA